MPTNNPRVLVVKGMLKGGVWPVGDGLTIGRNAANRLIILEMRASRFHAEIRPGEGGACHLFDLSSTGILLNGHPPTGDGPRLSEGDEITIAGTVMHFLEAEDPVEPADVDKARCSQAMRGHNIPGVRASWPDVPEATDEACQQVLRYLMSVVPAERGITFLLREDGELFQAGMRETKDYAQSDPADWIDHRQVERVMATHEPFFQPSRAQQGVLDVYQRIDTRDVVCSMGAPLLTGDEELMGVIYLNTAHPLVPLVPGQLDWVTSVASQAASLVRQTLSEPWVPRQHSGTVFLELQEGPSYPLGDRFTIGRGPDRDLNLRVSEVNELQVLMERRGTRWRLRIPVRSQRTWVNGELVTAPVFVQEGDEIRVGPAHIQLVRRDP